MRILFGHNSSFVCLCLLAFGPASSLQQRCLAASSAKNVSAPFTVVMDLGKIEPAKTSVKAVFPWENNESEVLEVEKIVKSCGCAKVTPTEGKIKPGETVEFTSHIDVSSLHGHASVEFTVFFKNRPDLTHVFSTKFYRPRSLVPEPKRVNFGTVGNPENSSRQFRITWVSDPNETGLQVLPNISTANETTSCRLINEEKKTIRLAGADTDTIRQEFLFEASINHRPSRGELHDTIEIPLLLNGKPTKVTVPVVGWVKGDVFSVPSKIFSFVKIDEIDATTITAVLSRQAWIDEPNEIRVTCNDPRLAVAFQKHHTPQKNTLGTISVTIQHPASKCAVDAVLNVTYRLGSRTERFAIPVKIVMIETQTTSS